MFTPPYILVNSTSKCDMWFLSLDFTPSNSVELLVYPAAVVRGKGRNALSLLAIIYFINNQIVMGDKISMPALTPIQDSKV